MPLTHLLARRLAGLVLASPVLLPAAAGLAQDSPPPGQERRVVPPLPGTPEVDGAAAATRPMTPQFYSSLEQGLSLQLPPGELRKAADPELLVLLANPQRNWRVELRRLALQTPAALASRELPEGGRQQGLLEVMANLTAEGKNGAILRQGLTPLGQADAGTFAVRYSSNLVTLLQQTALIRASDTLYYQLTMTSPAPDGPAEALAGDPNVRDAVAAFNAALNSYKKLDQTEILRDQEERLINARSLFVNLTKQRMLDALVPEQLVLVRKDGRDVGYRYVVEEPAREVPGDPQQRQGVSPLEALGVRVGVTARLYTDAGRLGRETWMYAAADMSREEFRERNLIRVDGKVEASNVVVGTMSARTVPKKTRVPRAGGIGFEDRIDLVDDRRLQVSFAGEAIDKSQTLERELPAWYVPQAIEQLLPRLAAWYGPNKYLVAVYAPDRKEVWQQYVDVEPINSVPVHGVRREAIVVATRLGLGGSVTRHYVEPQTFKWLGSVGDDGVENWPSDVATIRSIWDDANLAAPDARQDARQDVRQDAGGR